MTWKVLCIRCKDGKVGPLAKTKRDLSKKEQRRLVKKFRKDDDFAGSVVVPVWRLGLNEQEMQKLPII